MNALDKLILEIIGKENGRPISKRHLIYKIQKAEPDTQTKDIFRSLRYLDQRFLISTNQMGRIKPGYIDGEIIPDSGGTGVVFINNVGDGYIRNEKNNSEYYVNKKNLLGALSGDLVSFVQTSKQTKNNITDVIVQEVLERNKIYFVGTISIVRDYVYCNLDNHKISQKVHIVNPSGLVDGHKVWIKATDFSPTIIKAEVARIIGHKDDVGMDILSIVYDYGVDPEFDPKIDAFANKFTNQISDEERQRRVDLTHLPIVTIDPATSKDLDDSICVLKQTDEGQKDEFILLVSIADVAHFVRPNTVLDDCVRTRGTSIYLVDKVIPMLPHVLSNDICSLNPFVERLAMTCEIAIKADGSFKTIKIYDSIIKSQHRFSYEEVNNYFTSKIKKPEVDQKIWEMLDASHQLYKILQDKLFKRGFIDFEIKEPKIILNDKNQVIDVVTSERGDAQILIESFMIAANEAVTIYFNNKFKDQPFIYRVHDKPNESKLAVFQVEAKKINFRTKGNIFKINPKTISEWILENNFIEPKKTILNKLLLKTMAKAEYSTKNIGHFGLASKNYTHFTSPIRRFPDVLVHRILKMFIADVKSYDQTVIATTQGLLKTDAESASASEIQAVEIERAVNLLKFCEYMATKINEEFEGIVTHISANGIFVELTNLIEGMARLSNIKIDDFFNYDREQNVLVGEKTKIRISFGDRVKVKVSNVNIQLRQIDLVLLKLITNGDPPEDQVQLNHEVDT